MKQENWFFTPIWFEYLDFDTQTVAHRCLQMRSDGYPNRVLSNVGGWQSKDINLSEFPEFRIIDDILDQKINEFSNSLGPNFKFKLDNIWVNLNERGDRNGTHVHPITSFSGTIYIQVDENTGKIRFHNDYNPLKHYPVRLDDTNVFHQTVTYTPKNGMIVIFPAWVPHDVLESESDMTRISMSFNIKQIY